MCSIPVNAKYFPGWHGEQYCTESAPTVVCDFPGEHLLHTLEPIESEYVPCGQRTPADEEPCVLSKRPAMQERQEESLSEFENVPRGHNSHLTDPSKLE